MGRSCIRSPKLVIGGSIVLLALDRSSQGIRLYCTPVDVHCAIESSQMGAVKDLVYLLQEELNIML